MMIGLKHADLKGELSNLSHDQCELQVTSMLAHVWNEIEHDTKYKEKSGMLSAAEKGAINSLGLLTRTGDHIIESLLQSRGFRETKESDDLKERNGKIKDQQSLISFLSGHFGDNVAGDKIDYELGSKELLETLQATGWDHPRELCLNLSPNHMAAAKKLSKSVAKARKSAARNKYNSASCDLFLLAVYMLKADALQNFIESRHGNTVSIRRRSSIRRASDLRG
jgi:hypothetical protein